MIDSKSVVAWTILGPDKPSRTNRARWKCRCVCGIERSVQENHLLHGTSKSCGCVSRTKHRLTGTYISFIWNNIKQRCLNQNHSCYNHYGGRGIAICEYLGSSPLKIIELIGDRPSDKWSIDRIDNNSHYCCGACSECLDKGWKLNVRWATRKEQQNNRRVNVRVNIGGITKTLTEWASAFGIHPNTLKLWVKRGKIETAMFVV